MRTVLLQGTSWQGRPCNRPQQNLLVTGEPSLCLGRPHTERCKTSPLGILGAQRLTRSRRGVVNARCGVGP